MLSINGQKVKAVNPGRVRIAANVGFTYSIVWNLGSGKVERFSKEPAATAAEAKQQMRENVAFERKRHGV